MSGDLITSGVVDCLVQYAPFATRPRRDRAGAGPPSDSEREASRAVEAALSPAVLLDRFPKSLVEVHVLVLEAGGGEVPASVVAASLSLAAAGVDMVDVVAGAAVAAVAPPGAGAGGVGAGGALPPARLLIDPTASEAAGARATTTVCLMPRAGTLTLAAHAGEAAPDDALAALRLAMDGCATLFAQMRAVLVEEGGKRAKAAAAAAAARKRAAAGAGADGGAPPAVPA